MFFRCLLLFIYSVFCYNWFLIKTLINNEKLIDSVQFGSKSARFSSPRLFTLHSPLSLLSSSTPNFFVNCFIHYLFHFYGILPLFVVSFLINLKAPSHLLRTTLPPFWTSDIFIIQQKWRIWHHPRHIQRRALNCNHCKPAFIVIRLIIIITILFI